LNCKGCMQTESLVSTKTNYTKKLNRWGKDCPPQLRTKNKLLVVRSSFKNLIAILINWNYNDLKLNKPNYWMVLNTEQFSHTCSHQLLRCPFGKSLKHKTFNNEHYKLINKKDWAATQQTRYSLNWIIIRRKRSIERNWNRQ